MLLSNVDLPDILRDKVQQQALLCLEILSVKMYVYPGECILGFLMLFLKEEKHNELGIYMEISAYV